MQIPLALSLEQALTRDLALLGSAETVREQYARRYQPAQEHYLATVRPMELADAVVENADARRDRCALPRGVDRPLPAAGRPPLARERV
ncbi:MAG: hypothetical protein U0232_22995 [Thermomicrobiales bacterium]